MMVANAKAKLYCRRAMGIALFCAFAFIFCGICNWACYNDNSYVRVQFHELREADDVDVVFLGSSMAYRSFDPDIWDDVLGTRSFNLGTSSQRPSVSYSIMQDVFVNYHPKYCIYACRYSQFYDWDINDSDYVVLDNLHDLRARLSFLATFLDKSPTTELNLPFTREKPLSLGQISTTIQAKLSDNYRQYGHNVYNTDTEEYRGRGFVYTLLAKEDGAVGELRPERFEQARISSAETESFHALARLCECNACELVLVIPPCPMGSLALQDNYQDAVNFYREIATSCGIKLFCFTLAKPELFDPPDSFFYDHSHLNGQGASEFSKTVAELLFKADQNATNDDLFYSTYQDLLASKRAVYNAWLEDDGNHYKAHFTSGDEVSVAYQFFYRADASDSRIQIKSNEGAVLPKTALPEHVVEVGVTVSGVSSSGNSSQTAIIQVD